MDGVLSIDKPLGLTSFDVVARIRKLVGEKRVGHTGSLDPQARGVLVVCVGRATRIAEFLEVQEKEYRATITLGVTTDTLDAGGLILERKDVPLITEADLERALDGFRGEIDQVPPRVSALKQGGERLYVRARRGESFDIAPRKVIIRELELISREVDSLVIRVRCGKGTYIRSLARDIGERLGCGAHLSALVRTRNGPHELSSAVPLGDLSRLSSDEIAERHLQSMSQALAHLRAVFLGEASLRRFRSGAPVQRSLVGGWTEDVQPGHVVRVFSGGRTLVGVGEAGPETLRPLKVF